MRMRIGHAKVSSAGQKLDAQLERLADCDRIFYEKVSGATAKDRPELQKALDFVRDEDVLQGLLTRTNVKSSKGVKNQAAAEAGVAVRVVADKDTDDERIAEPGDVTFCRRSQELTAMFGGIMDECYDLNGDGITMDECTWTDEELQLILQTMNANAFNYVLDDLGAGDHTPDG